jgi:S-DNA-T family DNA segregation ATPase FtsK/SpoIIIE
MPLKTPANTKPLGKPAGKPAPGKQATKPPVKGGAKPAGKGAPPPAYNPPPALPPLFPNLSNERKLDLLGVGMALAGVLIGISLFSANRSSITGGVIFVLTRALGWGAWILPVVLILVGVWLIVRNIERIPPISAPRLTGLILLFIYILTALHWIAAEPALSREAAANGEGGGYIGGLFLRMLYDNLGGAGTFIALLAWLIIAATLTLDISVPELFARFAPLAARLKPLWAKLMDRLLGRNATATPGADSAALADDFTPLHRAPASAAAPPGGIEPAAFTPPIVTSASSAAIVWRLPKVSEILDLGAAPALGEEYIEKRARLIEETLASFGAPSQVVEINRGPSITQFGVEPLFMETRGGRTRVRVSKIVSLADDLALALAAPRIRIQAPVPGRSYVGIEVPNEEMTIVALRDILESDAFTRSRKALSFALGRDVSGHPVGTDLAGLPHLLIAGTTGSGKSVCVNAILTCLLLNNSPDELRLILVDPKRVELTGYNGVPHLLSPVVVELERVIGALQWMTREMDKRYHEFAQVGSRNIQDYNARMKAQGGKRLPNLVVVIDELADLMMLAPDETERTITRLAQLARATGIHLVLATQRPSVDVVTGIIKANFPARVAFAVASNADSRVILDQPGAERLLGRGDMLYQAPDAPAPVRLQGVFVSDHEIQKLVEFWRMQAGSTSAYAVSGAPVDAVPSGVPLKQVPMFEDMSPKQDGDPLINEAIDLIRREGRASVSMLQRKMRIGYTRAARLMDVLEERKIVGPPADMTGVRPVLDYGPAAPPKED